MTANISPHYHRVRQLIYRRHKTFIDSLRAAGTLVANGYWRSALSRWNSGRRVAAGVYVLRAAAAASDELGPRDFAVAQLLDGLRRGLWYFPPCVLASARNGVASP